MKEIETFNCRRPDYYETHYSKSERVAILPGMTMSGERLDGYNKDYNNPLFTEEKIKKRTDKKMICPVLKTKHCVGCSHSGLHDINDNCNLDVDENDCPKCIVINI